MADLEIDTKDEFFQLRKEEIQSLHDYIQERNTAILVIMFTDLKGFTQLTEEKGDRFSNNLRKFHDHTMLSIIEENHQGKIIKFIGDAVMAVFSEPTQAVDRALAIQREFRDNLQEHPELGEISVRIGLHMGQVAIDNSIKTDIFGRHVNRAARIEGLADGGQIYLTYPVFDSAKGWMAERPALGWARHGNYQLKGISDPIEVIEAYDTRYSKPVAPKKAKKKSGIPHFLVLAGMFLAGIFITLGAQGIFSAMTQAEVFLYNFKPQGVLLDSGEEIFLESADQGDKSKLNNPLKIGKHGLWWLNNNQKYAFIFDVVAGENHLRPKYTAYALPDYQGVFEYSETTPFLSEKKTIPFILLDENYNEISHSLDLTIDLKGTLIEGEVSQIHFEGNVLVTLDTGEKAEVPLDILGDAENGRNYVNTKWEKFLTTDDFELNYQMRQSQKRMVVQVIGYHTRP